MRRNAARHRGESRSQKTCLDEMKVNDYIDFLPTCMQLRAYCEEDPHGRSSLFEAIDVSDRA